MRLFAVPHGPEVKVNFPQNDTDNSIDSDQIGLHSSLYEQLFGKRFGEDEGGKPWKRGVLTVVSPRVTAWCRRIRLLFRGGALEGVNKDMCLIALTARVAFKLGLLAFVIAVGQVVAGVVRLLW